MDAPPFKLNRYDVTQALAELNSSAVAVVPDQGVLTVPIAGNETEAIEIYFPVHNGLVDLAWIERAREVLIHLGEMDNLVQLSCADECANSGLPSAFVGTGELNQVVHFAE